MRRVIVRPRFARPIGSLALVAALAALSLASSPAYASLSPGSELWSARYSGPASSYPKSTATATVTSPDGSDVFVTGESASTSGFGDYATLAYDASTGARLWTMRYDGPTHLDDRANALAVSPDGSTVFVTGYSASSTNIYQEDFDYATVAYNASTGTQLWVARFSGIVGGDDTALDVGITPDGSKVFVTGGSGNLSGSDDSATVAYDASSGSELWTTRYSSGDGYAFATHLGVSPDGRTVFVTGTSPGSTNGNGYATVAYDASTGDQLWARRYGRSGYDVATSLGLSPDGSTVAVTGTGVGAADQPNVATVAYNAATGTKLWVRRHTRASDSTSKLGLSPDGSMVFVTTSFIGRSGTADRLTIAYDTSTGATIWATRYNGPANGSDTASDLAVSPDGATVFTTGNSVGVNGRTDFLTAAYDATSGTERWARHYSRSATSKDSANALNVSPDSSRVFVTGASTGSSGNWGYATVAYEAG